QCWTQQHIAEELCLSQEVVSRMLKRMGDKLTRAFQQEIAQMRIEQTAQLMHIAEAAMNAWQACQQPTSPLPEPDTQEQTQSKIQNPCPRLSQARSASAHRSAQTLGTGCRQKTGHRSSVLCRQSAHRHRSRTFSNPT